jgi:SAM-dependent methyltransferase
MRLAEAVPPGNPNELGLAARRGPAMLGAMPSLHLNENTARAQQIWATGDFALIASRNVLAAELLCRAVDIHPGERVLDVAAGSGNTAIAAARRGGDVVATDFVAELLDTARRRAEVERLPLRTEVADAQALPYADAAFDVVLSSFGVMFAPDQEQAAGELLRVCRPGGRIGLANWTPEGLVGDQLAVLQRRLPAPPAGLRPSIEWGTETRLRELFGDGVAELHTERRTVDLWGSSAEDLVAFNRTNLGPSRVAFETLDDETARELAAETAASLERWNRATDGTLIAEAEYLEVVAVRA